MVLRDGGVGRDDLRGGVSRRGGGGSGKDDLRGVVRCFPCSLFPRVGCGGGGGAVFECVNEVSS